MKIIDDIMWLLSYLAGKTQFAPPWFYELPRFAILIYQGDNNSYKWFGFTFRFEERVDTWGDTLFMVWRNQRTERATGRQVRTAKKRKSKSKP